MQNNIETWLMKLGIKTYSDTYFTQLTGSSPTLIGQDMPKPVGWIYGISIETDSTFPTDASKPTITLGNAALLYLYFKIGTDLYMNNMRCDKLVFYHPSGAGNPDYSNQARYFPVNIPYTTDLKQSYYNNPSSIGSVPVSGGPVYIPLTIYYIDVASYHALVAKGYLFDGVAAMPHHANSPKHKQPVK